MSRVRTSSLAPFLSLRGFCPGGFFCVQPGSGGGRFFNCCRTAAIAVVPRGQGGATAVAAALQSILSVSHGGGSRCEGVDCDAGRTATAVAVALQRIRKAQIWGRAPKGSSARRRLRGRPVASALEFRGRFRQRGRFQSPHVPWKRVGSFRRACLRCKE